YRETDEHHPCDTSHGGVYGCGNLQIALAHVNAGLRQRRHFLRAADEHPNWDASLCEQPCRFCADLAGGGNENHRCTFLRWRPPPVLCLGIVRRDVADGLPFKSSLETQATAALGLEFRE